MKDTKMDYANMSDAELEALYTKTVVTPKSVVASKPTNIDSSTPVLTVSKKAAPVVEEQPDYSKMSDTELEKLYSGISTPLKFEAPIATEAPADIKIPETRGDILAKSEEFTGTLAPGEPKPFRAGTLRELNDPAQQAVIGLVKGGDVAINIIEGVPALPPLHTIVTDPGRWADLGTPVLNLAFGASEWLANSIGGLVEKGTGIDVPDVHVGRITEKFGTYSEDEQWLAKKREADSKQRKDWLRSYEATFKSKYNATPLISEVVSMAPDFLTVGAGSIANVPKYAAVMEGVLGASRATTEGTDQVVGGATGAVGGYVGTKIVSHFMNRLTPREAANINMISQIPELKADNITLLKFYESHPNISAELLAKGQTGNPVIDKIITRQREQVGDLVYNEYIKTLQTTSQKARISVEEVANEFHKGSKELYDKMKSNSDNAWDALNNELTITDIVPTGQVANNLTKVLENSPEVVRSFANKLLNPDTHKLAISDIVNRKKELHADYLASLDAVGEGEAKALKRAYSNNIKALDDELTLVRGVEARGRSELTADSIIEMIKKLNNKEYVAGGNIDTKNTAHKHALNQIRNTLEETLGTIPNVEKVKDLYSAAKASSKDMYETFGYNKGKNVGRKVYNHELGEVLEMEAPDQLRMVENMINESPGVFSSKLKGLKGKLPEETVGRLKQVYLEQRIKQSVIVQEHSKKPPRVSVEAFDASIKPLLDTADGRNLIVEQYGKETLDNLALIRSLNNEIGNGVTTGVVPMSTFKAWVTDLPEIAKTIFAQRRIDYQYTRRMLEGYGEEVKFDWSDWLLQRQGLTVGGAAAGGVLAPEGHEVEGIAAGALAGRYVSFGQLIANSKVGKAGIEFLKDKVMNKTTGAAITAVGASQIPTEAEASINRNTMPESLWNAELLGNEDKAGVLHGPGNVTIAAGIDLKNNKAQSIQVLTKAGVDKSTINALLRKDTSVSLTPEQVQKASDIMFQTRYDLLKKRLPKFDTYSKEDTERIVSADYYMNLDKPSKESQKTRGALYGYLKRGDIDGFNKYIKTKDTPITKELKNRFERGGIPIE